MGVLFRKFNEFHYVGIDQRIILVIDTSEKVRLSTDNIWEYTTVYKFPQNVDFELFNHIYAEEEGNGFFLQEELLTQIINTRLIP